MTYLRGDVRYLGRAKKRVFICLFAATLLSSCNSSVDEFDFVWVTPPTVEASIVNVGVGEPVTVTLATDVFLPNESKVASQTLEGLQLGVCFALDVTDTHAVDPQGFCLYNSGQDAPLEPYLQLLDGTDFMVDLGDITVNRGQSRLLTHEFTFTSTKAGKIVVNPNLLFVRSEYGTPDYASGLYTEVFFE